MSRDEENDWNRLREKGNEDNRLGRVGRRVMGFCDKRYK